MSKNKSKNQTLKSAFQFRRFVSLVLILVLLSNSTWASPALMGMYVDLASGWKQELRFRYYSGGWATMLLALFQGRLDDRPTKPKEKPAEKQDDRDAQVAKL